ncbi:hypothetical protein BDZ97DRAFT_38617 [Flammula alnicola]|nr:hypothetical protein BDZ97DRAFT_38617 [Flammula alnicola]
MSILPTIPISIQGVLHSWVTKLSVSFSDTMAIIEAFLDSSIDWDYLFLVATTWLLSRAIMIALGVSFGWMCGTRLYRLGVRLTRKPPAMEAAGIKTWEESPGPDTSYEALSSHMHDSASASDSEFQLVGLLGWPINVATDLAGLHTPPVTPVRTFADSLPEVAHTSFELSDVSTPTPLSAPARRRRKPVFHKKQNRRQPKVDADAE